MRRRTAILWMVLVVGGWLPDAAGKDQPGKPLILAAGTFDPLDLADNKGDLTARIQLVQSVKSARLILEELQERGCRVLGYLPEDTYVVWIPSPDVFSGWEDIRWRGVYRPEWKHDPGLAFLPAADAAVLQVYAHAGRSLERIREELSRAGNVLAVADDVAGTGHAQLLVPEGKLKTAIDCLASLEDVAWIAPRRQVELNNDDAVWVIQGGDSVQNPSPVFERGLTGDGEIIGIVDSGLDTDACQFRYSSDPGSQTKFNQTQPPNTNVTDPGNKVIAYYLLSGASAYDDLSKLGHGTHVAGCAAGDNYAHLASGSDPGRDTHDGMAPAAKIVFQDSGLRDGNQVGLPDSLTDMYVQAYNSGARIHNNSFGKTGTDTAYSGDSREVDVAAWRLQDLSIVFSSGNLGPASASLDGIGSTSKNPVVVGASLAGVSNRGYGVCHFSSQGPAADGRLRPDLVAPGAVRSALETEWVAQGGTDIYGNPTADSTTDPPNNNCTTDASFRVGTSFSAPLVSGAAALVRQYFLEGYYPTGTAAPPNGFNPSSALVKAVLINSAESIGPAPNSVPGSLYDVANSEKIADMEAAPNPIEGWGLLRLDRTLYFSGDPERFAVLTDTWSDGTDRGAAARSPMQEGQNHTFYLKNAGTARPLRVTLCWTDPAGSTGTGRALVNDLDLEVVGADGTVYKGNVNIVENRSGPAASASPDNLNPLEQTIIAVPATQNMSIRVIARHVPGNGANSPYPSTQQGYALVVTGDFEEICPDTGCPGDEDGGLDGGQQDAGGDPGGQDASDGGTNTDNGSTADANSDAPSDSGGDGSGTDSVRIKGGCACGSKPTRGSVFFLILFPLVLVRRSSARHA